MSATNEFKDFVKRPHRHWKKKTFFALVIAYSFFLNFSAVYAHFNEGRIKTLKQSGFFEEPNNTHILQIDGYMSFYNEKNWRGIKRYFKLQAHTNGECTFAILYETHFFKDSGPRIGVCKVISFQPKLNQAVVKAFGMTFSIDGPKTTFYSKYKDGYDISGELVDYKMAKSSLGNNY
jgi:hypothetical protein